MSHRGTCSAAGSRVTTPGSSVLAAASGNTYRVPVIWGAQLLVRPNEMGETITGRLLCLGPKGGKECLCPTPQHRCPTAGTSWCWVRVPPALPCSHGRPEAGGEHGGVSGPPRQQSLLLYCRGGCLGAGWVAVLYPRGAVCVLGWFFRSVEQGRNVQGVARLSTQAEPGHFACINMTNQGT